MAYLGRTQYERPSRKKRWRHETKRFSYPAELVSRYDHRPLTASISSRLSTGSICKAGVKIIRGCFPENIQHHIPLRLPRASCRPPLAPKYALKGACLLHLLLCVLVRYAAYLEGTSMSGPKRPDFRTMPSDLDWRPVKYVGMADPEMK